MSSGLPGRISVYAFLRPSGIFWAVKRSDGHWSPTHGVTHGLRPPRWPVALDFFDWLKMARQAKEPSDEELRSIAERWLEGLIAEGYREIREQNRRWRAAQLEGDRVARRPSPEHFQTLADVVSDDLEALDRSQPKQASGVYERWRPRAEEMARTGGLDFSSLGSASRAQITRLAALAEFRQYQRLQKLCVDPEAVGDIDLAVEAPDAPKQPLTTLSAAEPAAKAPTLAEVWPLCIEHYTLKGMRSWMVGDESGRPRKNQHANWVRAETINCAFSRRTFVIS